MRAYNLLLTIGLLLSGMVQARQLHVGPGYPYTHLEDALQAAQPGDTLIVHGGQYGAIHIRKPLTLIGRDRPILNASKHGTVVIIDAPSVTLSGFRIENSGISLDYEDAGIAINAPHARIENNILKNTLFGIFLRRADSTIIRNNIVEGYASFDVPRRGDIIRIWYSNYVTLENNHIRHGRDVIIWFANHVQVLNNYIEDCRYGLHFMYSNNAEIRNNQMLYNSVGVYLMYSRHLNMRHNILVYNRGASGIGIGLKDFDDSMLEENLIADNRVGIFIDNTPRGITAHMTYRGNVIAFNDRGIESLSYVPRSLFTMNTFQDNYEQVSILGGGSYSIASDTRWEANYWSDYVGFDADRDGFGDIPYRAEKVFEGLIDTHPELRILIYSPAIQALEFAARAFPIVRPEPKLVDRRPSVQPYYPTAIARLELPSQIPLALASAGLSLFGGFLLFLFHRGNLRRP